MEQPLPARPARAGWPPVVRSLLLACCVGLPWVSPAAIPELVIRDTALPTVEVVELFRNGVYWWTPSSCSGEFARQGGASYLAYTDPRILSASVSPVTGRSSDTGGFHPADAVSPGLSLRALKTSAPRGMLLPECSYGAAFVRDDEAFYYAKNRQLHRKPLTASVFADGEPIRYQSGLQRSPIAADGALLATASDLWSYASDFTLNTVTVIRTWKSGVQDVSQIRPVLTLPGAGIRKFAVADIQATDGSYLGSELIILLPDGNLYRAGVTGANATLVRGGVLDFALRNESYLALGNLGVTTRRRATTLYMAVDQSFGDLRRGSLLGLDLNPGARGTFTEYPAPAGYRVTSVAADGNHLFLTRTPSSGQANSELLRRRAPTTPTVANPGDPDYESIAVSREFRSLRSTGRLVYFAHENTVQRVEVNAPAIAVDFEAFGVEATQAIQNMNNSVPLVAKREVVVRGYARVVANSTGRPGFDVPAHLRVYHSPNIPFGQAPFTEVEGSPLLPVQSPTLAPVDTLGEARTNLGLTYVFQVPASMIPEGELRFAFLLNPGASVPETGTDPLANNASLDTLTVKESVVLPLTMVSIRHNGGFYDPNAPNSGFWNILNRARTLLPFARFHVRIRNPGIDNSLLGDPNSFTLPAEDSEALFLVSLARVFDAPPLGGPYVGMAPPAAAPFNGIGQRPGNSLVVRMANVNANGAFAPWNSARGGISLAHEFCHNTGFRHFRNIGCGSLPLGSDQTTNIVKGNYDGYPSGNDACTLDRTDLNDVATSVGFDPISWTLVPPAINGELMSYSTNRWISEYNWVRLYEIHTFRAPPFSRPASLHAPPPGTLLLLLQGRVDLRSRAVELLPSYSLPVDGFPDALLEELTHPPEEAPFQAQFLDAAGQLLESHPVGVVALEDGAAGVGVISRAFALPEAARMLRLVEGDQVRAELPISVAPPLVDLGAPQVGDRQLSLSWNASDPDGDALRFTAQLSTDGGQSWNVVGLNQSARTLSLPLAGLPGGSGIRARVIATDGARSTIVASAPFDLPKHPPAMEITGLADGRSYEFGTVLSVLGHGYDAEDGSLEPTALTWSLAGPEPRQGSGDQLALSNLAPGAYELTLTGLDSDGQIGTRTVRFEILPFKVAEGEEPVLDGLSADPGYARSPAIRMVTGNGLYATVRFTHAAGALFVCYSGLRYADVATSGAIAGLRVNLGGNDSGLAVSAGFGVNEHGEPLRIAGTGTNLLAQGDPPEGFAAVILRDENTWSAELRIADALLGTWSERLGLALLLDDGHSGTPPQVWPAGANPDDPSSWSPREPAVTPPGDALVANGSFEDLLGTFVPGLPGTMSIPLSTAAENLLPYGDAEGLEGGNGANPVPVPGWTVEGNLTVIRWDDGGGGPAPADPGPEDRGANYFAGGPDSGFTRATVRVPLPLAPERIDAGQAAADLSGWFGGFLGQADSASLSATFLTQEEAPLGTFSVGGVTPEMRTNRTVLLFDQATRVVPPGARFAEVVLSMQRTAGVGYNDGYADSLRFGVRELGSAIPGWSPTGGGIDWAVNGNDLRAETPEGSHFVDLTGSAVSPPYGGVTQTVATEPDQAYELSFALGAVESFAGALGPVSVQVTAGPRTEVFTFTPTGPGDRWKTFTLPFKADSATTVLAFVGIAGAGQEFIGLDAVSVVRGGPDPGEAVTLLAEPAPGQLNLRITAATAGRRYTLETSTDLGSSAWTEVPGSLQTGDGNPIRWTWTHDAGETQRFFRVRSAP